MTTGRFDYVKYDDRSQTLQATFKSDFESMVRRVEENLPYGRATSLVMTKLEEAYMWVGKAIRDDQNSRGSVLQEERTNS